MSAPTKRHRAGMSPMHRGHRVLAHTADSMIEAWAPDRAGCLEEAVRALVDVLAEDAASTAVTGSRRFDLAPAGDVDALVLVLEEAAYCIDVHGEVPMTVAVDEDLPGRLRGHFGTVPLASLEQTGPAVKGVSREEAEWSGDAAGGWRCRAIVDV